VSDTALIEDGRRTLVVEVMGLGDLVMTTPALRSLREVLPSAHIGFACRAGFEGLLRNHPCVDRVFPFPATGNHWLRGLRIRRWIDAVRADRYEQAIVFDRHRQMHVWLQQAGIPRQRIFLRVSAEGDYENPRPDGGDVTRAGNTDSRDVAVHISDQYLGFVEKLLGRPISRGLPEIFIAESDHAEASAMLARHGIGPDDTYWVSHAGLSSFSKGFIRRSKKKIAHRAWPLAAWSEFHERALADPAMRLVLTGSRRDAALHRKLLSTHRPEVRRRICDLAGKTHPLLLAALLARARGYVGVDTGPMHVAAALGTPVVALFGPTNPLICGPRGSGTSPIIVRNPVHCSPCVRSVRKQCHDNICMRAIDPVTVLDGVMQLSGQRRP
jgi:ADP-heptose:LPS heptosyltransferase